ncbi:hypothetical protein DPMN_162931 [Dreissena polymorpha]|uniref:Uncharacterized protein n=1 Tax=Dreissena polymorpha TaxID=45954 RepID=A0A9D4ESC0_DREPO|nr:hypothetical protein DPMN_162931 [Dreissena polymorpha]
MNSILEQFGIYVNIKRCCPGCRVPVSCKVDFKTLEVSNFTKSIGSRKPKPVASRKPKPVASRKPKPVASRKPEGSLKASVPSLVALYISDAT